MQVGLTMIDSLPLQVTVKAPVLWSALPLATCWPLPSLNTYEMEFPDVGSNWVEGDTVGV
jgi:hypothetical protein